MYAEKGVRFNVVVPGLVDTPYTDALASRYGSRDQEEVTSVDGTDESPLERYKQKRDAQVPMGRMGDAWDVANAALFLVSDEARYITGQKIVVDGGITSSTGRA